MALLISKRERNLLIDSKIANDYPLLQKFIKETPDMDDSQLNILGKEFVRFFKNIYPKVLKRVIEEWVVDEKSVEYYAKTDKSCELCGQRPINNICVIENIFTKKRLKIGTSCVRHFGISKDININKLLEESKKIKRLEYINNIYPGIQRKIDEWDLFVEEQPILIGEKIKQNYIKEGLRASDILETYLDSKTTEEKRKHLIKEMKQVLINTENGKVKIQKYVKQNESNLLIPDRELVNRMIASGQRDVVNMIEKDGEIRHRTLFRIKDKAFAESLIDVYNKELKKIDCKIDKVITEGDLSYQITYENKHYIKLFCKYEKLCSNYYSFITGDEDDDITLRGLIKISNIRDEISIKNALTELFSLVTKDGLLLKNIYYEYDDFIVYNQNEKAYYSLSLKWTINKFKEYIFLDSLKTRQVFRKYVIKSCRKPISKKDFEYLDNLRNNLNR